MFFIKKAFLVFFSSIYTFSSLGNYGQFTFQQVEAAAPEKKVNIVAIFVDTTIYDGIKEKLDRYTNTYIPKHASDTKTLVMPINPTGFKAQDVQRILENLYFEGEQGIPSKLAGVMLLGNIPLPIVEFEQRRFASVYPYTDFEHEGGSPMFVYDPVLDIFVFNEAPDSLPEIWHSVIPGQDVELFNGFFDKVKSYDTAPTSYAKPKVWIDDFPFLKQSYTQEQLDHYINKMLFTETESYRRINSLFGKVLKKEYEDDLLNTVATADAAITNLAALATADPELEGSEEAQLAAAGIAEGATTVVDRIDAPKIAQSIQDGGDKPVPTLLLEKTLETEFAGIHAMFGDNFLSQIQDNLLAGGRYQLEDIDTSIEKITFRDTVSKQFIEDMNTLMENALDEQINKQEYFLKYPLPYLYIRRINPGDWFTSCVSREESLLEGRYENFYYGRNAADVLEYSDLSIMRGSYYNELNVQNLWGAPLAVRGVEKLEDIPGFDLNSISVGAGYGRNALQVSQNRAFNAAAVLPDKDTYDKFKCDDDQDIDYFARDFRGGASALNSDTDRNTKNPKFPRTKTGLLTNRKRGRHPSIDRRIGGPWHDVSAGVLLQGRVDEDRLDRYAHHDNGSVLRVNQSHCEPRRELNEYGGFTSYEEIEFFDNNGDFFDGFGVYKNQLPDEGINGPTQERITITVHDPTGMLSDTDEDGVLNYLDPDMDGDGIADAKDPDVDGDRVLNGDDNDIDGDGPLFRNGNSDRLDLDIDKDGIPNHIDPDIDNDGKPNAKDENVDGDWKFTYGTNVTNWFNNSADADVDGDGIKNESDDDIDGDGTPNGGDTDMDGDGIPNEDDPDMDKDETLNPNDKTCNGGGGCNGSKGNKDADGDGVEDKNDPDQDGDGIPNTQDDDQDGDGLNNYEDNDVDADDLPNDQDTDDDNDGYLDSDSAETSPQGFGTWTTFTQPQDKTPLGDALAQLLGVTSVHAQTSCDGQQWDIDHDDITNDQDPDIDGDGIPNHEDLDMDGDGITNDEDEDMDCDGIPNGQDRDTDGDGVPNDSDSDCNGNGIPNSEDGDIDGDGIPNGQDPDIDGDGMLNQDDPDMDGDRIPNLEDYLDLDGDGIPNNEDRDMDGDGIPNIDDLDIDADGLANCVGDAYGCVPQDSDCNCNGVPNGQENDSDSDGIPDSEDQEPYGSSTIMGFNREERGELCFDISRDYRYQLINTVTKHKGPVYDELDQMNVLTQERPIDDPRYVSFMGLGGDLVKFIYPDMYRVSIFEGSDLRTKEQIEEQVRIYLRAKTQIYNQYLNQQLDKAPSYYALHQPEYDFLAKVDEAASPNRAYELIPENYLIDLLGERNIKRLAESLYHLNVTWKESRPQASTVGEYVTQARKNFDLNDKIEFIMDEYLQYDTEEFMFDHVAYPNHIEKGYAYEVGILNSDGNDRIKDQPTFPDPVRPGNVAKNPIPPTSSTDIGDTTHEGFTNQNTKTQANDLDCGVDPDLTVKLTKRPKAITCWLEKTFKSNQAVEFDLTIEVETQAIDYLQQLDERKKKVSIRPLQIPRHVHAITHDIQSIQIGSNKVYAADVVLSGSTTPLIVPQRISAQDELAYHVLIDAQQTNYLIAGPAPQGVLALGARKPLGVLNYTIRAEGENCPTFNAKNLCTQPALLTLDPFEQPINLPLQFASNTAGTTRLLIEVCQAGVCFSHDQFYAIAPGPLAKVRLVMPTQEIVAGGTLPIALIGEDALGNRVDYTAEPLVLTIAGASLSESSEVTEATIHTFSDARYLLSTAGQQPGSTVTLTVTAENQQIDGITTSITLVDPTLQVKDKDKDNQATTSLQLIASAQPNLSNALPLQLALVLPEGRSVLSPVSVRSRLGLVRIGKITNSPTGQSQFTSEDTFLLGTNGEQIVVMPSTSAGSDELIISVPGKEPFIMPITIASAGPSQVAISLQDDPNQPNNVLGTLTLLDSAGNIVTQSTEVELESWGPLQLTTTRFLVNQGVHTFSAQRLGPGEIGVRGRAKPRTGDPALTPEQYQTQFASQTPPLSASVKSLLTSNDVWASEEYAGFGEVTVESFDLLRPQNAPEDDLNIMYLSLFGHSRGNLPQTAAILGNSKTLAITTQFDDTPKDATLPPKIATLVSQDAGFTDPLHIVKELRFEKGSLIVHLGNNGGIGSILLGSYDRFYTAMVNETIPPLSGAMGKVVYTPLNQDTQLSQNEFINGKLLINGEVLLDMIDGVHAPSINIRLSDETTNTYLWEVRYNNLLIGTFTIMRGAVPFDAGDFAIYHGDYATQTLPVGGSSTNPLGQAVVLVDHAGVAGNAPLFESVEAARDPLKAVGTKHQFSNVTNFAQGMPAGEANRHFANPFTLFMGDPFLERVKDNREVTATDYDDGIGQKIFSDTKAILDTDPIDVDKDGLMDLLIAYQDGSLRLLKNYGGTDPFKDLGMLLVVGPGLREVFVGDVDGDGRQDILTKTNNDKLVAYRNDKGKLAVDPYLVCLDITNGDKNIAQAKQLLVEDMDDDGAVDLITNADGQIKVFYGGSDSDGPNYLSTQTYTCDDGWRGRQQDDTEIVKTFDLQLTGPIRDGSLRYWPGLLGTLVDPEEQEIVEEAGDAEMGNSPDMKKWSRKKIEEYTQQKMKKGIDPVRNLDPKELTKEGLKNFDYVMALPDVLRPDALKRQKDIFAIRAQDDIGDQPRFDASKTFLDLNGGDLRPGDKVKITVKLEPIGGSIGPIAYWEQLAGPRIIYKDEYGKIQNFSAETLGEDAKIQWNIGNGYEFMLYDYTLNGTVTFSYEVQYEGKVDVVSIQVETDKRNLFRGPTQQSVIGKLFDQATAQVNREWVKRIRAYPADDGCYKKYRLFSPGEQEIKLDTYLDKKTVEYEEHFNKGREDTFKTLEKNYELDPLKQMMGILPSIESNLFGRRTGNLGGGGKEYLNYFVDEFTQKIENWTKDAVKYSVDKLGVFEEYEFGYQKCKGVTFGKNSCGQGLPIPFNMAFLSPGTYNIMGCKPKFPQIPKIFPNDAGLPIFAVPTNSIVPIWPVFPSGAGGLFGGNTSQFRMYISPTITNGLGLALCFGPYGVGMKIKSPVGDVVGNCLVIAGSPLIGSECTDGDPVKDTQGDKRVEASPIIEPEQHDLYQAGVCDVKAQQSQPFISKALGGRVAMDSKPTSIQSTLFSFEQEYLKGGNAIDLKIEGGDVKGLAQCIIRKWGEKQMRYFANNALNMHMFVMLPQMRDLTKNLDQIKNIDLTQTFRYDRKATEYAFAQTDKPGTQRPMDDPKKWNDQIIPPRSVLEAINEDINNPFEIITQYFNNIPLINIDHKSMAVEVPFIYQEDIAKYSIYLESWLERNKATLAAWESFATGGKQLDTNVYSEMQQAINHAERNLVTVKAYRELPLKLSALLHTYDQYVTEVYQFVEKFVTEITGWLQLNANRFSQRVDVVVLLIGIIETRQILIDFSVNRNTKCAKCRQDNYDFYSCKLSLLCVDLPILPIPNFDIPDIYLDLSDFKVGLDIILPKINFVPRKIPLLQLPDIPSPAPIDIDLDIPAIPLLPQPPPLPELPKLNLDIDIKLPELPPAPKIPKISPAIETVVELADFIGSIYCIFKSGLGLVAEQGVKTRIEQMTQRKQDISPFDELKITIPDSPRQGFDYKIASHVDLKFDFSVLYDALDGVVETWHDQVNQAFEGEKGIMRKANEWQQNIDEGIDYGQDIIPGEINIDLGAFNPTDVDNEELLAYTKEREKWLSGGDYEATRERLLAGLQHVRTHPNFSHLRGKIDHATRVMTMDYGVQANYDGVDQAKQEALQYISSVKKEYQVIADQISTDYDGFLDTLSPYTLVSNTVDQKSYQTSLFTAYQPTVDLLTNQPDPRSSYIAMHKPLVDGYAKTLQNRTAYELNMNQLDHTTLQQYFAHLQDRIAFTEQDPLLAQANGPAPTGPAPTQTPRLDQVDFTQYIKGFFVPGKDGNYHNVVAWDKGDTIYRQNRFEVADLNGDAKQDILLVENNQLSVKYGKQNDLYQGPKEKYTQAYTIGPWTSAQQLEEAVRETQGWFDVQDSTFKIRDDMPLTSRFLRKGHNFTSMSFRWENDPTVAGYVISLGDQVTTLANKDRQDTTQETKYIVVIPQGFQVENVQLDLPDQLKKASIETYQKQGKIIDVISYDGTANEVKVLLQNLPKTRYYTKVAQLALIKEDTGIKIGPIKFGEGSRFVLKKVGPWTQQRIAGAQFLADDQPPVWSISMIRDLDGSIAGEGPQLNGYINTAYTLRGHAKDDGEIVESWVMYSGNIIAHAKGPDITLPQMTYTAKTKEEFLRVAIDQAGNQGSERVQLHIDIPSLRIDHIDYQSWGAYLHALLGHDIDFGLIRFEKNRQGYWQALDPAEYPVKAGDPLVVGGKYNFADDIALYTADGKVCGSCNKKTAELTFAPEFKDRMESSVGFGWDGKPVISVKDKEAGQNIFSLKLESKALATDGGVHVVQGGYETVPLDEPAMRDYIDGVCIRPVGQACHFFVGPTGTLYLPPEYREMYQGTYSYDTEKGFGIYTISTQDNLKIFEIHFIPKPFQ